MKLAPTTALALTLCAACATSGGRAASRPRPDLVPIARAMVEIDAADRKGGADILVERQRRSAIADASPSDPSVAFLDPKALSATPYIYLIPAGVDSMRSPPLGDVSVVRSWNVDDVAIPMPFNIGASEFSTKKLYQSGDSLSEALFSVRKHQAFRPVSTDAIFTDTWYSFYLLSPSPFTNRRLIGRSVWNSKWKLVIPGRSGGSSSSTGGDTSAGSSAAPAKPKTYTVQRGDTLATLDTQDYQNRLRSAEAEVSSAEAALVNAQGAEERQAKLLKDGWTPKATYDTALQNLQAAEAREAQRAA